MISQFRLVGVRNFSTVVKRRTQPTQRQPTDLAEYFYYTRGIVASQTSISEKFVNQSLRFREPKEPIDIDKAKRQHANYVRHLSNLIPEVVAVPSDGYYPDQVFVEDPVVVLEGTALLSHMKPRSRTGERGPMKAVLEQLGLHIVEMTDPKAYLDGGDVLFTGREFLVGLSERTNKAGVEWVAKAFPHWPVTGITVRSPVLHLKSMSSMAGIDLIAISESPSGNIAWKEIETHAHYKYNKLGFPDDNGANCLFINGVILHPPKEEYPESYKVWEKLDCEKIPLPNSELAKADGSLTCNSIRVN